MGRGGGGRHDRRKNAEFEISCVTVCRSEYSVQFWRHGRSECDGCQKGEKSIALEHSKRVLLKGFWHVILTFLNCTFFLSRLHRALDKVNTVFNLLLSVALTQSTRSQHQFRMVCFCCLWLTQSTQWCCTDSDWYALLFMTDLEHPVVLHWFRMVCFCCLWLTQSTQCCCTDSESCQYGQLCCAPSSLSA